MTWHGADITFILLIDGEFKDAINDPGNKTCNGSDNRAIVDKFKKLPQLPGMLRMATENIS